MNIEELEKVHDLSSELLFIEDNLKKITQKPVCNISIEVETPKFIESVNIDDFEMIKEISSLVIKNFQDKIDDLKKELQEFGVVIDLEL